jgi:hypothetical protein
MMSSEPTPTSEENTKNPPAFNALWTILSVALVAIPPSLTQPPPPRLVRALALLPVTGVTIPVQFVRMA